MSIPLRDALRAPFDSARWRDLLGEIFSSVEFDRQPVAHPVPTDRIRACREFGRVKLADGRGLVLLEIEIGDSIDLLRNRVELRNLVARFIDQDRAHGVLAFIRSGEAEYRLTFASRVSEFDEAAEIFVQRETATRRFTYILGPGQPCRTAATRLAELAAKRGTAQLKDLIDAFSVDVLNKDFFRAFCGMFDLVVAEIRANHEWPKEVAEEEAQTLLDRLIFLYFIQRKGWLDRDRQFLSRHFHDDGHAAKPDATTYLDSFLRPVFKKLSTPGSSADVAGHDLPFLNGGLFADEAGAEQRDDAIRRRTQLRVRNHVFTRVFDDLLDIYAFTIHEDSPLDHEVAVDPEMLGLIFESLILQLDQTGAGGQTTRDDTGSFYTPRPSVRYLCREALATWLGSLPIFGKGRQPDIRALLALDASDGLDESELATLRELLTPDDAEAILRALDSLRACDPAVGSGAFPIGLLHELVNLARLCATRARGKDPVETDSQWLFDTKTRFIERAIYGVDLQARAIEICKLRLWLSLVVDYPLDVDPADCSAKSFRDALRKLPALPNLDFKIRRANSLTDMIHGEPVNLGKLHASDAARPALNKLSSAKLEFFHAESVAKKRDLQLAIFDALTELAEIVLRVARNELGLVPDEHRAASVAELERARAAVGADRALVKSALQSKARVADKEAVIEQLRARFDDPEKPTFVWQLDFAEVFQRPAIMRAGQSQSGVPGEPGFDIVVGNPPYVRHEKIKELKPLLKDRFECFEGTADLFVYFYERAVTLLRLGGALAFITSNKFYRAGYGGKLRAYLARELTLHRLIDFGDAPVFDAIAYASILVGSKVQPPKDSAAIAYTWEPAMPLDRISEVVAERGLRVAQSELTAKGWRLESPVILALIAKLRAAGKPLGEYVKGRIYRGILTGLNEAFVVDRATRDRLVAEHNSSAAFLKPFLRGRDVKRWAVEFAERYLIKIESSANRTHPWTGKDALEAEAIFAAKHPAIHRWLKPFRAGLIQRDDQGVYFWELRSCVFWDAFSQPKVIIPSIVARAECAVDADAFFCNDKTSICVSDDAPYLAALLNSAAGEWFIRKTAAEKQGGFFEFKPMYASAIPIPAATPTEQATLTALVDRILAAKRAGDEATVKALEAEIDTHVFRLYGLTAEERKLIEGTP